MTSTEAPIGARRTITAGRTRPSLLAGGIALGLLAAVAALISARVNGPGGPWLWYYDLPKSFWPNAVFWHDAARAGGIPLWIDRLGLGYPVYAEGQIASFYLPNWLIFQLQPLVALDATRILHLTIAGLGSGLIGLRMGGAWSGAALATCVAVLGGGIVAKLEWTSVVTAFAWAPWVLLPLLRRPRPTRAGLAAAGVAWGIQALAGHPNTWILTGICAAAVLFAARPGFAAIRRIVGFALVGAGVGAIQLLPTMAVLSISVRSGGLSGPDLFANSATILDPLLAGFANAFVPGSPDGWDLGRIWYPGGVYGIHEAAAYVGLPVLALAAVGAPARRSRPLVAAIAVMVILAAAGAFQPDWWASTPILNGLRHPVRAYMLAALLAGPLAAVGLARISRARRPWRPAAAVVGGLAVAYGVLAAVVVVAPSAFERLAVAVLGASDVAAPGIRENAAIALTHPFPALAEMAAGIAAVALIMVATGRLPVAPVVRSLTRPALVLVAVIPLAAFSPMANPVTSAPAFDFGDRPLMAAVRAAGPARFLADADPIFHDALPNQPAAHGVADLGMWSSLNLAASEAVWRAAREGPGVDTTMTAALGIDIVATFGDAPCPGVVLARVQPHDVTVCRLATASRPPLWLPAAAVAQPRPPAGSAASALDRVVGALRPSPVDVELAPSVVLADGRPADVVGRDDGWLSLVVDEPAPGWVWIDRAWWPGWETTIDGLTVVPLRALGGQLVPVGAGRHEIRQRLVPLDALLGLLLALITLAATAAWILLGRRGRRTSSAPALPLGGVDLSRSASTGEADDDARSPRAEAIRVGPDPEPSASPAAAGDQGPGPVDIAEPPGTEPATVQAAELAPGPWDLGAAEQPSVSAASPRKGETGPDAPPERASVVGSHRPLFAALLVIAFALAWFAPPVAIAVAWPFLFAIPGWLLVSRVVPRLGRAGRLGVGIVVSTFAAAHLGNLIGLAAGGFDRPVALATAAILAGASLVLAGAPLPFLAPAPSLDVRGAFDAARRERAPFVLAAFAVLLVGGILAANAWHQIPTGWVSGGWNWSDFLVHVSIGQSIVEGNFPPQVPYFAGVPLTYHWFADFHGAIAAAAAGLHVIPVFIVSSALMAGALALIAWELARHLTGSRRAATIATLLILTGGGMGWIRLVLDVQAGVGSPWELVRQFPYDNTWAEGSPEFKIASILGTGLFPHRATTFGLPGLLSVLLLVRVSLGRHRVGMGLAGILAALLAPFHFYFFPATYLLALLYAVARRAWRRRGWLRDAALFLAPIVLALPFFLGPALLQRERGAIRFVQGWSEAPFEKGPAAVAFFYATNLGIPLLLGLLALLVARPPARTFLAAWALALFLVPNLVVAGAVEFDMNKYFQVMGVALAILGGWLLRRRAVLVAGLVVALAAISPALIATWHLLSEPVALSTSRQRAAEWIADNTPHLAVFVTDAFINSPVDLAGRLRITTFGPYAANLGYDPAPREVDVRAAYCDGPAVAAEVMARYGATYVLSPGGIPDCADGEATDFGSSPLFETVYAIDGVEIWRLRG